MVRFLLALVALCAFSSFGANKIESFSGHYKLTYLESLPSGGWHSDSSKSSGDDTFDYSSLATPEAIKSVVVLNDAKALTTIVTGGGLNTPRTCQGQGNALAQQYVCEPLLNDKVTDPATGCQFSLALTEGFVFTTLGGGDLKYFRAESLDLNDSTAAQCGKFKEQLAKNLEDGKASEFFKAMKAAKVITDLKNLPDTFTLIHVYRTEVTTEKDADTNSSDKSGAYQLTYAKKSTSASWLGDRKTNFQSKEIFDYSEYAEPAALAPLLVFYDLATQNVKLAGADFPKTRQCASPSKNRRSADQSFTCPLITLNEVDGGTGCKIGHSLLETITFKADGTSTYARAEYRNFLSETATQCEKYKTQLAADLKNGKAEYYYRLLLDTEGIESADKLGDNFLLVHQYTAETAN